MHDVSLWSYAVATGPEWLKFYRLLLMPVKLL